MVRAPNSSWSDPMQALDGRSVLIVGGSSGIGLAVAEAARIDNAKVTIAGRSQSRLDAVADRLPGIETLALDVSDETSVARALDDAGPFAHVVVTPGSVAPNPVRGGDPALAEAGFGLKFWGAYRVAAHARIEEGGSLTLVSGVYALRPAKGHVIGSCVNAAVDALAKALALELAPVRVNSVSPGLVDTPLWESMPAQRREAMFAEAASRLPAQRTGTADDVADLILTCMRNRMLTGAVLVADGGHVLV
jgi:NAD(P)-dependent dehydrogenase (short-subunit alcohol dehydrogenase family)